MTFAGPRYVADGTFWYDLLEDMEIDVRVQHPEDPSASSNTIRLERSLSSLGAVRFWFRCPLSDRRVAKLYLPPGSGVFGSRPAHGLAYRSQRISRLERAYERARRVRQRLGGTANLRERFPQRPPRMHRRTYQRLLAQASRAEETILAAMSAKLPR